MHSHCYLYAICCVNEKYIILVQHRCYSKSMKKPSANFLHHPFFTDMISIQQLHMRGSPVMQKKKGQDCSIRGTTKSTRGSFQVLSLLSFQRNRCEEGRTHFCRQYLFLFCLFVCLYVCMLSCRVFFALNLSLLVRKYNRGPKRTGKL